MNVPKGAFDLSRKREWERRKILLINKNKDGIGSRFFRKPGIGYAKTHGNFRKEEVPGAKRAETVCNIRQDVQICLIKK